MVGQVYIDCHF